jgi:hypothetical protein
LNNAVVHYRGQNSKIEDIKIGDPALLIVDRPTGAANPTLKAVMAWSR